MLSNEIILRPRFTIELSTENETALKAFETAKTTQSNYHITRIDNHVFIKIPKDQQHFWSPQLHLEIIQLDEKRSTLYGLFGPSPTVWTLFMFLHFLVGTLFIGFAVWAYSNYSLGNPFHLQTTLMVLLILCWFALYFGGRIGKSTGNKEMRALDKFMREVLEI